jgi:Ni/Co efflux regulator RcnB
MKKYIALTVVALLCAAAAPAAENKPEKKKDAPNAAAKSEKAGKNEAGIYDADANGQINGTEVRAVQEAYKQGANLKAYDTNHDGALSDAEIAKIRTAHKDERAVKPGKVFIQPKRKGKGKR